MLPNRLRALALASLCSSLVAQEVKWWEGDLDGALQAAAGSAAGSALLYFWSDGDGDCVSMYDRTIADKDVQRRMAEFVCLASKKEDAAGKTRFERFGVEKVPTILFVRPDGSLDDRITGYVPVKEFVAELERIRAGRETLSGLRAAVGKQPDDLALQLRLARKLQALGDPAAAAKAIEAIVAKDPKARSEPGAEARLMQICDAVFVAGVPPAQFELKPLEDFLVSQRNKRVLFLGYDRIASVMWQRRDLAEAAVAVTKAWKNIPDEYVLEWGQSVATKAYEVRADLDRRGLKLALDISTRALEAAEAVHAERGDHFMAQALYLHACMQNCNNQRKQAFASMERAIALAPDDENLVKALEAFRSGAK